MSVTERLSALFHRHWRRGVMRSGMGTGLILAIVAVTFIIAYGEHRRGDFHKLKEKIATEQPETATPLPGGQETLALTRTR